MQEIKTYLDKMFTGLPATEKVRKAKSELLMMMTDKYKELIAEGKSENEALGTVIMEFGNLNELSEELGLTEEIRSAEARTVTLTRADAELYRRANDKYGLFLGIGVALFILSPVQLIINAFIRDLGVGQFMRGVLLASGLILLLIFVAGGIAVIIYAQSQKPNLSSLKNTLFRLNDEADAYVRQNRNAEERHNTLLMIGGIACFIFAAVPPVFAAVFSEIESRFITDAITILAVVATLIIVAGGVILTIYAANRSKYSKIILNEHRSKPLRQLDRKVNGIIGSIWALTVPVYIIVSFMTQAWGITWIIFPLVAAIGSIIRIATGVKDSDDD